MARKRGHSTLQLAMQKYAAKVPVMPTNYNAGVARFLGVSPAQISGSVPGQKYQAAIGAPGVTAKWESNLMAAFGAGRGI